MVLRSAKPSSNRVVRLTCLSFSTTINPFESDGGSAVYRDSRKYSRPSTVTWSERLHNSVSFIGTVDYPVTRTATKTGTFGVYTCLRVTSSPHYHTSFRILLNMWDEMAMRAMQHVKPNDYMYVSGQLGSYTKNALQGIEKFRYQVTVKELNYISKGEPEENFQRVVISELKHGESTVEKYRRRLHLWHVFFANPNEWYDQRRTKKTLKHPDFKHKSTGEALWVNVGDPPWIQKQLELLDSRPAEEPNAHDLASKSLFGWASDD